MSNPAVYKFTTKSSIDLTLKRMNYERDFGAKRIPSAFSGGPKRYMLADEDAWNLFSKYLTEEDAE